MHQRLRRARHGRLFMLITGFAVVLCSVYFMALGNRSSAAPGPLQPELEPLATSEASTQGQVPQALIDAGRRLFLTETFAGNGRTCATCHRPERNFSIAPAFIATLPPTDPLFVGASNAALQALEDSTLLDQRGLVMVHADGFARPPVFRAPPALFNLALTAPYGLNNNIATLAMFITDSVVQHFPKTPARVPGVDFRLPTPEELDALVAFVQSLMLPPEGEFRLDRLVHSAAPQRGRALFFGTARCAQCHGGPVFSEASAALPGGGGNRVFNTGVNTQELDANVQAAEVGRGFSVPSLFGVRHTAPFFHNNSAATLRDAVAFYTSSAFNTSPAAMEVGTITLTPHEIDDLVAFLQVLTCPRDGDVNNSGKATPADALLAFQHFLGFVALDVCAQIRANVSDVAQSSITPSDALCIFRHFLGLPSCLDNAPPVASVGPAQFISPDPTTGKFPTVTLTGSGSDADDDDLSFLWSFDAVPQGSKLTAAALSTPTAAATMFVPDVLGMYRLTLVVTDTGGKTTQDKVLVNVQAPTEQIAESCSCQGEKPDDIDILQTRVKDAKGNPVPNWPVTFRIEQGDGSFLPISQPLRMVAVSVLQPSRQTSVSAAQPLLALSPQNTVALTDANGVATTSLVFGQRRVQVVNIVARAQDVPTAIPFDIGRFFVAPPPVALVVPVGVPDLSGTAGGVGVNIFVALPPVALVVPAVVTDPLGPGTPGGMGANIFVAPPPVSVHIRP